LSSQVVQESYDLPRASQGRNNYADGP
jgi:hypothetical protein